MCFCVQWDLKCTCAPQLKTLSLLESSTDFFWNILAIAKYFLDMSRIFVIIRCSCLFGGQNAPDIAGHSGCRGKGFWVVPNISPNNFFGI